LAQEKLGPSQIILWFFSI